MSSSDDDESSSPDASQLDEHFNGTLEKEVPLKLRRRLTSDESETISSAFDQMNAKSSDAIVVRPRARPARRYRSQEIRVRRIPVKRRAKHARRQSFSLSSVRPYEDQQQTANASSLSTRPTAVIQLIDDSHRSAQKQSKTKVRTIFFSSRTQDRKNVSPFR